MQYLAFRNDKVEVHRLHGVGDFKRGYREFSSRFRSEFDRNFNRTRTGVGYRIVERLQQRLGRLRGVLTALRNGGWADQSAR